MFDVRIKITIEVQIVMLISQFMKDFLLFLPINLLYGLSTCCDSGSILNNF